MASHVVTQETLKLDVEPGLKIVRELNPTCGGIASVGRKSKIPAGYVLYGAV